MKIEDLQKEYAILVSLMRDNLITLLNENGGSVSYESDDDMEEDYKNSEIVTVTCENDEGLMNVDIYKVSVSGSDLYIENSSGDAFDVFNGELLYYAMEFCKHMLYRRARKCFEKYNDGDILVIRNEFNKSIINYSRYEMESERYAKVYWHGFVSKSNKYREDNNGTSYCGMVMSIDTIRKANPEEEELFYASKSIFDRYLDSIK